ncbi:stress response protein yhbh, putative [Heliomicrobium modesticaldum Ice1]|uniref:Stress response protein yhbh, putative n=1 Tax=Heliobacterium modesticaldum (strain ATCC 51547 / Ice1) TaxID=498761 RepID=B0TDS2_HELMI|nr:sporulation protein YhbH [Heliomicrobium modesticaldum]ABZ82785.1 stress response protein yhbh, putative [Heliomicrobium modesticaldum Ice1]
MAGDFSISREDWSLHRKGFIDQTRHQEKVREAIKKNLPQIISEEALILNNGQKTVKVPIRSLEEYRIRYDYNKQKHIGQGNGDSKVGDVLGRELQPAPGQGNGGAGSEPGLDYFEAEVDIDELEDILFADLHLPNMEEKAAPELETESYRFNDIRKKGLQGNIDRKRTLIEAFKRNALKGTPGFFPVLPEDLRYKTWEIHHERHSNAVVLAMMDTSGSMGNFEKYIARTFFFWMTRFLRSKYHAVQIVFVAHHTEAKEVTEEEFFTKGESGGTRCSSAYQLANEIIDKRFPPQDYNIYAFHFSDGDNLSTDNEQCVRLVNDLLGKCNQFGYGEIVRSHFSSTLMNAFRKIQSLKFSTVTIRDKSEVYGALKTFFKPVEM